ncbi:hypothetical protein IAD21_05620 [Abditibacteriota bacterium]|nr:hypothetical protein IAD21_05620 [Abditibacteriota bacterium]
MRRSIHNGLNSVTPRFFCGHSTFWLLGLACGYGVAAQAQPPDPPPPVVPEGIEVVRTFQVPGTIGKPMAAGTAEHLQQLLEKARCGGKYRLLLQQIAAPEIAKTLGEFRDLGQIEPPLPLLEPLEAAGNLLVPKDDIHRRDLDGAAHTTNRPVNAMEWKRNDLTKSLITPVQLEESEGPLPMLPIGGPLVTGVPPDILPEGGTVAPPGTIAPALTPGGLPMTTLLPAVDAQTRHGHWVYAFPYWYVWHDLAATARVQRSWGPEQAVGAPDTELGGDFGTAWASRSPDEQDEWLLLEYDKLVTPRTLRLLETFNPGAVRRITVFNLAGEEVEVFNNIDPLAGVADANGKNKGVFEVGFHTALRVNRVKVYLDSKQTPGWNEIDAVGLTDEAGTLRWATTAAASSTYAEPTAPTDVAVPNAIDARVAQLEAEVRQLKQQLAALQQRIEKQNLPQDNARPPVEERR